VGAVRRISRLPATRQRRLSTAPESHEMTHGDGVARCPSRLGRFSLPYEPQHVRKAPFRSSDSGRPPVRGSGGWIFEFATEQGLSCSRGCTQGLFAPANESKKRSATITLGTNHGGG
jgi:hypothetical protein